MAVLPNDWFGGSVAGSKQIITEHVPVILNDSEGSIAFPVCVEILRCAQNDKFDVLASFKNDRFCVIAGMQNYNF